MESRLLVSWIGDDDFRGMARSTGGELADEIVERIGPVRRGSALGPISALLEHVTFRQIQLMNNRPKKWGEAFSKWLRTPSVMHDDFSLGDPTNYSDVFAVTDGVLSKVRDALQPSDRLCIHLSPSLKGFWCQGGTAAHFLRAKPKASLESLLSR